MALNEALIHRDSDVDSQLVQEKKKDKNTFKYIINSKKENYSYQRKKVKGHESYFFKSAIGKDRDTWFKVLRIFVSAHLYIKCPSPSPDIYSIFYVRNLFALQKCNSLYIPRKEYKNHFIPNVALFIFL